METRGCIADEQLNIYLDGELAREEHAVVAAHLDGCPHCRTRLNMVRMVGESLRVNAQRAVDAADFSGVWSRVRAEAFPSQPAPEPRRSWLVEVLAGIRNIFSPAMAAVALVLLVVAIYFTAKLQPLPSPPPSPSPSILEVAVSNEAQIISLETDSRSVMVLQSPDSGATIIIISNNTTETDEESTI